MTKSEKKNKRKCSHREFRFQTSYRFSFRKKTHKSHHLVNGYLAFPTEFLRRVMCSIKREPKNFLLIYFR